MANLVIKDMTEENMLEVMKDMPVSSHLKR